MREDFLHYVWRFQKFDANNLKTSCGQCLYVERVGTPNSNAGPDFLMGQVIIGDKRWVGHIEIHIKASDWLAHGHTEDPNYETVILHVVWENDKNIDLPNGGGLPVLELKSRVDKKLVQRYNELLIPTWKFIVCEQDLGKVPDIVMNKWLERLFLERLQKKCEQYKELLEQSKFHWEAVCFYALAKAFGMKVNVDSFLSIAQSINYTIIQKCQSHPIVLEALFMGQAGLLEHDHQDSFFQSLKATYGYLVHKFKLHKEGVIRPQFFRLRPSNFPTIRISQLAVLLSRHPSMMSVFRDIKGCNQAYQTLRVESSNYWHTHYNFGLESPFKIKKLSKPFIDVLLINVVLPLQFLYGQIHGNFDWDSMESFMEQLPMESNKVLSHYLQLRGFDKNIMTGQALLHLHGNYCSKLQCVSCEIGNHILMSE